MLKILEFKSMNITNIKRITVAIALTFVAMADVYAQTCPTVSSNTTVTSSCNTGITWTGGNLTIGTPTSGSVSVSSSGAAISGSGALGSLENTSTGSISTAGNGSAINNLTSGSITTLNNLGEINALNGAGISNDGTINTLNNYISGSINTTALGARGILNVGTIDALNNFGEMTDVGDGYGIDNYGTIAALNNEGSITSSGGGATGISNNGTIATLNNSGTIATGALGGWGIDNYGTITTLTNSGTISAGVSGYGFNNAGTITTLNNYGTISAGTDGQGVYNGGLINTLTNTGLITGGSNGIQNLNTINTLTNNGAIIGDVSVTGGGARIDTLDNLGVIGGNVRVAMDAPTPGALNSIGTLNNSGSINGVELLYFTDGIAGIEKLNNTGHIHNGINIILVTGDALVGIGALLNNGVIDGGIQISGIDNFAGFSGAGIKSLINNGAINGGIDITHVFHSTGIPQSGIESLTNMGSILGGITASNISSGSAAIATLNNYQGGNSSSASTTALTYSGALPTNYNIGISSPTHYGQLFVNPSTPGTITNFGIYGTPLLTSRTYSSILSNNVTVTNLQSTYDNMSVALVANGGYWDLTFTGASLMGTQQSLVNTVNALAPIFTLQNSVLANSFSYDCNEFGVNNICISAGGRNTAVSAANGLNNTSALLIGAYRPHPNYRIGAYIDQNLSVNNVGSTVNLGNNTPLIGLFGVWSERLNGTGTEVKVSAAYGQKNATITRQVVGLSESGSGSSQLNSQGAQVTAKYGFGVAENIIVSPYIGMRYTQNNMNGYTEATSSAVTSPLTYSALNTNATTALAGAEARYRGIPKTTLFASAGVETDTNTSNGTYSATGIAGLTPVNFNPNPVKTRPTATVGGYYNILKNQRIGVTGIYRQEPFQAVSTTTVLATYTIGL